jgi:DNA-binding transcriptional ArsR family regulator
MVVHSPEESGADRIFRALSNGTRRDILRRVMRQDMCVSALAKRYPMSFAAVQKHVAVLESAGLVDKQASGREQIVRGNSGTVGAVRDLLGEIEDLWRVRLDRFEELLKDD